MPDVIGGHAQAVNGVKAAKSVLFWVGFWGVLFAIVLAPARAGAQDGAGKPANGADGASGTDGTSGGVNAPSDFCVDRLLTPLEAMAGVLPDPNAPKTPWLARVEQSGRELALRFGSPIAPARFDVLVATIADPLDSGLGYQYETSLQALRRGVEQAVDHESLYRDRSFLPWDDRDLPDEQQKQAAACRVTTPGIMLFRGGEIGR